MFSFSSKATDAITESHHHEPVGFPTIINTQWWGIHSEHLNSGGNPFMLKVANSIMETQRCPAERSPASSSETETCDLGTISAFCMSLCIFVQRNHGHASGQWTRMGLACHSVPLNNFLSLICKYSSLQPHQTLTSVSFLQRHCHHGFGSMLTM